MPFRDESGKAVDTYRRPKKPKPKPRPVAKSIPEQRTGPVPKPRVKPITKPTPKPRRKVSQAPGDAYSQIRRSERRTGKKILDRKGRQRSLVRQGPRKLSERNRIHRTHDGVELIPLPRFRRLVQEQKRELARRKRLYADSPHKDDRISPRDPKLAPTKVAGINLDAAVADLDRRLFPEGNPGLRIAKAPLEIAKATVEDPEGVAKGTARGLKDTLTGLPSAAVKAVTDPEEAANQIIEDYKRRYGPLLEGDERAFRERIKDEGLTAEALDVAGVASVGGKAAGLAKRAIKKPKRRPKLRTSGGAAKPQRVSGNLLVEAGQRLQDRARGRVTRRRLARAEQTGGRVSALDASVRPDEVAPIRRKRRQRIEPAKRKSRGVQAMKAEQAREVHRGATKAIAKLNRQERKGFKFAMQLGIRDSKTGRRVLERRRAQILEARKAEDTEIPKALRKTNDELRVIDEILEAPEKVFTPRLAKIVEGERNRELRVARGDPGLVSEQRLLRRHAPLGEHLGLKRGEGEGSAAYVRRVKKEAAREGLTDPAYFPSQKRPTIRHSDYALGGTKAVAEDKTYTGALFRTGREDTRPAAFTQSLAKNIKRKHNWSTVADNFDANAFSWGKNRTISKLLDELDRRNIDPGSVAFWNPRKYRDARGSLERQDFLEEASGDDIVPPGLTDAVDAAAVDAKGLATKGGEFRDTSGWSVVPKAVYDEIHADTRPSGAVARSWDVLKGKQSRILLGTNPPWLAFQAASNVLLTGLARTGPIDAVKAQLWWRRLDREMRADVEPYVGVGPFAMDVQQTKLGAATNARLVNSYRAFKATPLMQRAGKANPLDLLFRLDNAQNNFFRRSVLYSQAKRDAYRRLGQDVGRVAQAQARIKGLFTLGPRDQIARVVRDREAIEQHAEYVNSMLGDYVAFTARERRILGRSIMFYGFLRFSLHFAFWTMPTRHPVVSAIVGNLARLQTEEVRELLGGDELPFALGRLYITKDGKLQTVELGRANPAANALTELVAPYEGGIQFVPRRALGLLPPMVGAALDMAYGKSAFTNRPLRVQGEHTYAAMERDQSGREIALEDRGRIAAERFLDLFYPYRAAEAVEFEGQPQGDDSLLWDPRPTKYKDEEIRAGLTKERRRQKRRGVGGVLVEELTPFLPHPSRDPQIAEGIRERRGGGSKKKAERNPFKTGSTSGEDNPFKQSSASDEPNPFKGEQQEFDQWRDEDESGSAQSEFDKYMDWKKGKSGGGSEWDKYRDWKKKDRRKKSGWDAYR